jgi:hypothetical protein
MGPDGRPWVRGAMPIDNVGLPGRVVDFVGSNTAAFDRSVTTVAQTRFFAAAVFRWQSGAANNFPQLLGTSSVNSSFRLGASNGNGLDLGLVKGGVFALPTVSLVSGVWYAMITSHDQSTGAYYITIKPLSGGDVTRATGTNTAASSASDGTASVGTSRKDYSGTWNGAIALAYTSFQWVPEARASVLLENPWQIFAPVEEPVFYSLGGNTTGAGSSSITFAASAVGAANKPVAGSSSFTFAASATGAANKPATGSASLTFAAEAEGSSASSGAAVGSASLTFAATGAGASIRPATGSATLAFSAQGVSTAPAVEEAAAPLLGGGVGTAKRRRRYILPDDTEVMATDVEIRDILQAFVKPKPQPKKRGQVAKVVPLSARVTLEPDPVKNAERVVVDMKLATWSPDQEMLDAMVRQIVTQRRRRTVELLLMAA